MKSSDKFNPFYNRSMIMNEEEFIGRTRELADITERLQGAQSVSILGEKKIGKSSLLYHLYLSGNERMGDRQNCRYQFLYMDMHNPALNTPELFTEKIVTELSSEYDPQELKESPLITLSEALENNSEKGKLPVLLIDDFEEIVKRSKLFNDDFIDSLRFYANSGLISVITASRKTLREIMDKSKLTSPFWNIFTTIKLKEFAFDDKLNETEDFLEHYWKNLNITKKEKCFLLDRSADHPLKLQIISYWLIQKREMKIDNSDLCKKIEKEIASLFNTDSNNIKRAFKNKTVQHPEKISRKPEFFSRLLSNLIRKKDLF